MYAKWVQKSMDFEVENRKQVIKKGFKNMTFFLHGFFIYFGRILEGLGRVLGGFGEHFGVQKGSQKRRLGKSVFFQLLGGFWEGLGRVWGGFWEGFGRVWELFGCFRDL